MQATDDFNTAFANIPEGSQHERIVVSQTMYSELAQGRTPEELLAMKVVGLDSAPEGVMYLEYNPGQLRLAQKVSAALAGNAAFAYSVDKLTRIKAIIEE